MESLAAFVSRTKQAALQHLAGNSQGSSLLLIMGNTAGDLDSAASAIGLSYLLTHYPNVHNLALPPNTIISPLLQTDPADTALRPENTLVFGVTQLRFEDVLSTTDLRGKDGEKLELDESVELSPSRGTLLGLVDHAALGSTWRSTSSVPTDASTRKVVLVVDHHVDEQAHLDAKLRIIQGVGWNAKEPAAGSASSVVTSLFAQQLKAKSESVPRELADLLISANLIDTDNIRPVPEGKAAKVDQEAFSTLLPLSSFGDAASSSTIDTFALSRAPAEVQSAATLPQPDEATLGGTTKRYWGVLIAAKNAVQDLSARDLLRRDYKEVLVEVDDTAAEGKPKIRLGFSSVPMGMATWLGREGAEDEQGRSTAWKAWWSALLAWAGERDLDGAVVGTSFRELKDGETKHRRETIIALTTNRLSSSQLPDFYANVKRYIETDAQASSPTDPNRLMLELPWKGASLPQGGRARVAGLDEKGSVAFGQAAAETGKMTLAAAYRQGNAKASRKQVLPAVVGAVKAALRKL